MMVEVFIMKAQVPDDVKFVMAVAKAIFKDMGEMFKGTFCSGKSCDDVKKVSEP